MESTESSYEFENETSSDFSIWRFSLQGHSLDTFPKGKIQQKTAHVLDCDTPIK